MFDQYRKAIDDLYALHSAAVRSRELLEGHKHNLALCEAAIRISPDIDGKNAEIREAQFLLLCRRNSEWENLYDQVNDEQANLGLIQAAIEEKREQLSLYKRQIDFRISLGGMPEELPTPTN